MRKRLIIVLAGGLGFALTVSAWAQTPKPADPNGGSASKAENEAFAAQKKSVLDSIAKKDIAKADAACQQLLSKFDKHKDIAQGVYDIAKAYGDASQADKAGDLYQYVIGHWHESEYAIHAQRDMIHAAIKRKDAKATQAALDTLLIDFAQHKDIAGTIYNLGKYYNTSESDGKTALRLHQYNVEHYPTTQHAMYSQVEIIKAQVRIGDDAAVDAACDKLLTTFGQQKGLAKEVYQIGAAYTKARNDARAERFYQYVLDHWPEDENAIRSGLALLDKQAQANNAPAVDAAFDKLIGLYAKQKTPAKEIYNTAMDYSKTYKNSARKLHQFNSSNSAKDDPYVMWSQTEVAKAYIRDGNEPSASAAVNDLVSRFASQATLPTELAHVGDTYVQAGKYERADQVYNYIREHWSRNEETMWAKLGKARISIAKGNDKAADAVYKQLLTDYANDPNLPQVVMVVGEGYMERGLKLAEQAAKASGVKGPQRTIPEAAQTQLRKALAVWAPLTDQPSPTDWKTVAEAQYCTVIVYSQLNKPQSVLEQGARLVQQWPNYAYAWQAYPLMVKVYKKQMRDGKITPADGQVVIDQLNGQLLEKYPACPAAAQVRKALQKSQATTLMQKSDKGGEQ